MLWWRDRVFSRFLCSLVCTFSVFVGHDDAGGVAFSPQDWIDLGRQLMNEVETRTSQAIESGKFTYILMFAV